MKKKMEYVYAALLLHAAGKEVNEANVKKVLESAGAKIDESRIKALLAGLEGVDIEEVISKSASMSVAAAGAGKTEAKEEEEPEEKEVSTEEAAQGLGALFG